MWRTLAPSAHVVVLFTMVLGPALPLTAMPPEQAAPEQITGALLDQLRGMDLGQIEQHGDAITVTRPEGTYVFENIARDSAGAASASVAVYDAEGRWLQTITFNRGLRVVDDNRIDFEAVVASADETGSAMVTGSLAGLRNQAAQAVGMIDTTGQTRLVAIDFRGMSSGRQQVDPVILTPLDDVTPRGAATVAAGVVIVVVVFVVATCLMFGWWGC